MPRTASLPSKDLNSPLASIASPASIVAMHLPQGRRMCYRPAMLAGKPNLRQVLEEKAKELGFCAFGVARADAAPRSGKRLREWIAGGAHGDMIWMEETAER